MQSFKKFLRENAGSTAAGGAMATLFNPDYDDNDPGRKEADNAFTAQSVSNNRGDPRDLHPEGDKPLARKKFDTSPGSGDGWSPGGGV